MTLHDRGARDRDRRDACLLKRTTSSTRPLNFPWHSRDAEIPMRFLVDIYRYVLFAVCCLTLILASILLLVAIDQRDTMLQGWTALWLLSAFGIPLMIVVSLGSLAILFSLHDRHLELVDQVRRIADALEADRRSAGNEVVS
jgi:hypothetical protein